MKVWAVANGAHFRVNYFTDYGGGRMFYQERLNKKRNAEIAKRNRERLRDPSFFPSVPKDLP